MKNLDLTTYGVVEMTEDQMKEIDGGIPLFFHDAWYGTLVCPIWYETDLDAWCTNSDLWYAYA
ncbi:MAG: hypothetical protein LBT43_00825 [Prevotella sp.]|jgi:hypothetical protein|nr:hypothetical protein [Prevotella sp.]